MPAITQIHQIDLHDGYITKPRWSPRGRFLAIPTQSGSIPIFDTETDQIAHTLGPHSAEVTAVTWDRNSEFLITGSLDRTAGLWELSTGRRAPFNPDRHKGPIHSVEWTDEEAYLMTCSSDRVCAFDGYCLRDGWSEEMEEAVNKYTGFTSALCSAQTTFLLGLVAENGALLVLASLLSADILDHARMPHPIRCAAWSPTEELLAVAAGESILLFHATQEGFAGSARELTGNVPDVHSLAFSADGVVLASRDRHGVKIWDVGNAKLITAFDEDNEDLQTVSTKQPVPGIAFHPERAWLADVMPNGRAVRILELGNVI
jgi:WD40 repeat protein